MLMVAVGMCDRLCGVTWPSLPVGSVRRRRRSRRRGRRCSGFRRSAQLRKQRLELSFETNDNKVGAEYAKRVVLPRNALWEREHGAVRITTVPYGY